MTLAELTARTHAQLTTEQRRARDAQVAAIDGRSPAATSAPGRPAGATNYKCIKIGRRIYESRAEAIRGERISARTLSYWLSTGYAKGVR